MRHGWCHYTKWHHFQHTNTCYEWHIHEKVRGGVFLSNSLYLLCVICNLELDTQYVGYEKDFNSLLDGINQYTKNIRVHDGTFVGVHYFRNITVYDNGEVQISVKQQVLPFADFRDYQNRLTNSICKMTENAKDDARKQKYGLVTTISKGYDAPCCAVVAKKAGCDVAVTFKAEGKYAEDSGVEVARKLGYLTILERDAMSYLNREDMVEAEYICSGELGAQISFSAFDNEFKGNLVFTGERGDSVWDINNPICNDEFHFIDVLNHLGSCERKLWVGYVSVPMPLYGASSWTSIQRISKSEEMKPWSIGTTYDRPIPRRMCEESGLDRNDFGISKHGAGFLYRYDWMKRIKSRMSMAAGKSFEKYVHENANYKLRDILSFCWHIRKVYLGRLGFKCNMSVEEQRRIVNPTAVKYLIPWAGSHMIRKYEQALRR